MHRGREITTNTAASWEEVSREVLAILVDSNRKPAPKIWGALSGDVGGKTKSGGTLKSPLKFFPSSSSSAATRDEKTEGTEKQQSLINWLEQPQRKMSLTP